MLYVGNATYGVTPGWADVGQSIIRVELLTQWAIIVFKNSGHVATQKGSQLWRNVHAR